MTNLLCAADNKIAGTVCSVLALIAMFALPALIIFLTKKVRFFNTIGAIALCYVTGLVLSLIPIPYDKTLTMDVASILVAVAIPLILFSFDLTEVRKLAKSTVISFALVIFSTIAMSVVGYFVADYAGMEHASQLAGMSTGLYIGGTPNLVAIGTALIPAESRDSVIAAANTSDLVVGGIYFFMLLTVLRPVYRWFLDKLGKKKANKTQNISVEENLQNTDVATEVDAKQCADESATTATSANTKSVPMDAQEEYDFRRVPKDKKSIGKLIGVIFLAIGCLGVGAGLELLISGSLATTLYLMIAVSVLGIAFSFVKPIRNVKGSYQIGQYMILVFSLGLAMSLDITALAKEILPTLAYFACVQIASALLHLLLCKIFRIDSGTALITSTAGIYGPPFVAPVANAYGDRKLIAPGIICGTVGLAVGNLLGLGIGSLLALI